MIIHPQAACARKLLRLPDPVLVRDWVGGGLIAALASV